MSETAHSLENELLPLKKPALMNGGSPSAAEVTTPVSLADDTSEFVTDSAIRQRIALHSADLHDLYFSMRSRAMLGGERDREGLEEFSSGMFVTIYSLLNSH